MITEFIRLVFSILVHASVVMVSFALYSVWIKNNHKQIALLGVLMGGSYYITRFYFKSEMFLLVTVTVFIIGLTLLRKYPIAYSILVGLSGYAVSLFFEETISYAFMRIMKLSIDELVGTLWIYVLIHITTIIIFCIISLIVQMNGWGLKFGAKRFEGRFALKKNNYIWAALLILCVVWVQIGIIESLKLYHLVILGVLFIIALTFTLYEHRKILRNHFLRKKVTK